MSHVRGLTPVCSYKRKIKSPLNQVLNVDLVSAEASSGFVHSSVRSSQPAERDKGGGGSHPEIGRATSGIIVWHLRERKLNQLASGLGSPAIVIRIRSRWSAARPGSRSSRSGEQRGKD